MHKSGKKRHFLSIKVENFSEKLKKKFPPPRKKIIQKLYENCTKIVRNYTKIIQKLYKKLYKNCTKLYENIFI